MKKSESPLWRPSDERIRSSNLSEFMRFLKQEKSLEFETYDGLYQWSIDDISSFWESIWAFGDIKYSRAYDSVLSGSDIRAAKWFEGARLNFAENLLKVRNNRTALLYWSENQEPERLSFGQVYEKVVAFSCTLRRFGVRKGDRVAAVISNRPEAVIGMLATTAIGAIWSSCSPDFGFKSILDRFGQIQPKVLLLSTSYSYNGKVYHLTSLSDRLLHAIPSIEKLVSISGLHAKVQPSSDKVVSWEECMMSRSENISFEQVSFDHPLYIMYSSGTTGKPKCIVHGVGGTLLQHVKELKLHTDLKPDDVIFYYTTCGWMMWNWMVSALSIGATLFLYDGSPMYPNSEILFKAIDRENVNAFGTSPKYLSACEQANLKPKHKYDLSSLKTILSTGSPLADENFEYVYEDIKSDVQLSSISGGTDIISCFLLGNPLLPVQKGKLQCRGLGMKVEIYDDDGQTLIDEVGELVCTAPFPSRPIHFWNDENDEKYKGAYFERFKGIWHHGDFAEIDDMGMCTVYGRSDATLNPGGIRIGTSEIYGPVESLPEIADSIVVAKRSGSDVSILLFVVLAESFELSEALKSKIKIVLKSQRSPRHVPQEIRAVNEIPRTFSGKKVELAVNQIVHGLKINNLSAIANPWSLEEFKSLDNEK